MSEPTKCPHKDFKGNIRITTAEIPNLSVSSLIALVTVKCTTCGKNFVWKGPQGLSLNNPLISPDQITLRAPLLAPPPEEIEEVIFPKARKTPTKPKKQRAPKPTIH